MFKKQTNQADMFRNDSSSPTPQRNNTKSMQMNPPNKVPQTKKSINGLVQKQVWVNMNDPVQK